MRFGPWAAQQSRPMATMHFKNLSTYTVYDLYSAGTRFAVGFTEQDAIDRYIELHPEADRAAVERDLREQIEKHRW